MKNTIKYALVAALASSSAFAQTNEGAAPAAAPEASDLSLDDILSLNVGSLLGGSNEEAPATIYTYTAKDIRSSAAQDLSEFLYTKVPGSSVLANPWNGHMWGFRGIVTDRAENTLYNINGEMQNLKSRDGVVGDAYMGLLEDIAQVDLVVGPGSVIHGAGAIAGVVNLELKDGRKETALNSMEVKAVVPNGNSKGVIAQGYHIAKWGENNNSVLRTSIGVRSEHEKGGDIGGYHFQNLGHLDQKYDGRNFEKQARVTAVYTNEAQKLRVWARAFTTTWYPDYWKESAGAWWGGTASSNDSTFTPARGFFENSFSSSADKKITLSDKTELKLTLGATTSQYGIVDSFDGEVENGIAREKGEIIESLKETRLRLRADLTYKAIDNLPMAGGLEVRQDQMGKGPIGTFKMSQNPTNTANERSNHQPFLPVNYMNYAAFGEIQYTGMQNWKPVFGARVDAHTRVTTTAPRLAMIYTSDDKSLNARIVGQQAFRVASADQYEPNRFDSGAKTGGEFDFETDRKYDLKPAKNTSFEVGFIKKAGNMDHSFTVYNNDLVLTSWQDSNRSTVNEEYSTRGFEVKSAMKLEDSKVEVSHSYVALADKEKVAKLYTKDNKNFLNVQPNVTRFSYAKNIAGWDTTATGAYYWGISARDKSIEALKNSPDSEISGSKNKDWLKAPVFKLDLNTETKVGSNGRFGVDLKNILALADKRNSLDHTLDYSGNLNQSYGLAYQQNQFTTKVYYAHDF